MIDNLFKISVIICAVFFITKLIINISFWLLLTSLINTIKKQTKQTLVKSENLVKTLEEIAQDIASVTSIINIKKTQLNKRKKEIAKMRKRLEDKKNQK